MTATVTPSNPALRGALYGVAAAALFGVSAPIAKWMLGSLPPVLLAGLLYLGAAVALQLVRLVRHARRTHMTEAPLTRKEAAPLAAVVALGGIIAPVLMLLGLSRMTATAGSLMLNMEAPFTVIIAAAIFKEHIGYYAAIASVFIFTGAGLLQFEVGAWSVDPLGILLLAAACAAWAIDNNLTQRLSLRDPFAVVRVKTAVAGIFNTALGVSILVLSKHPTAPHLIDIAGALLLGSASYGASVVLDAYALRLVGAAREAAYFATAPFVGAVLGLIIFPDTFRWIDGAAMATMAVGVVFLVRERHQHNHVHTVMSHEHSHIHDEHHQHDHDASFTVDANGKPHSHSHHHEPLSHSHPHTPDAHHRHRH
jgi:drug/metabolite transporter (DMT)-like permease